VLLLDVSSKGVYYASSVCLLHKTEACAIPTFRLPDHRQAVACGVSSCQHYHGLLPLVMPGFHITTTEPFDERTESQPIRSTHLLFLWEHGRKRKSLRRAAWAAGGASRDLTKELKKKGLTGGVGLCLIGFVCVCGGGRCVRAWKWKNKSLSVTRRFPCVKFAVVSPIKPSMAAANSATVPLWLSTPATPACDTQVYTSKISRS
jgi:hypothetical protein